MKISKPLVDVKAPEKDKVTFECELSRPNAEVKWFKVQNLADNTIFISVIGSDPTSPEFNQWVPFC